MPVANAISDIRCRLQEELPPALTEIPGPLSDRHRKLATALEFATRERFVPVEKRCAGHGPRLRAAHRRRRRRRSSQPPSGVRLSARQPGRHAAVDDDRRRRVTCFHELMDAAHDAPEMHRHGVQSGRVPIIDVNPRHDRAPGRSGKGNRRRPGTTTGPRLSASTRGLRTGLAAATSASGATRRSSRTSCSAFWLRRSTGCGATCRDLPLSTVSSGAGGACPESGEPGLKGPAFPEIGGTAGKPVSDP